MLPLNHPGQALSWAGNNPSFTLLAFPQCRFRHTARQGASNSSSDTTCWKSFLKKQELLTKVVQQCSALPGTLLSANTSQITAPRCPEKHSGVSFSSLFDWRRLGQQHQRPVCSCFTEQMASLVLTKPVRSVELWMISLRIAETRTYFLLYNLPPTSQKEKFWGFGGFFSFFLFVFLCFFWFVFQLQNALWKSASWS